MIYVRVIVLLHPHDHDKKRSDVGGIMLAHWQYNAGPILSQHFVTSNVDRCTGRSITYPASLCRRSDSGPRAALIVDRQRPPPVGHQWLWSAFFWRPEKVGWRRAEGGQFASSTVGLNTRCRYSNEAKRKTHLLLCDVKFWRLKSIQLWH